MPLEVPSHWLVVLAALAMLPAAWRAARGGHRFAAACLAVGALSGLLADLVAIAAVVVLQAGVSMDAIRGWEGLVAMGLVGYPFAGPPAIHALALAVATVGVVSLAHPLRGTPFADQHAPPEEAP